MRGALGPVGMRDAAAEVHRRRARGSPASRSAKNARQACACWRRTPRSAGRCRCARAARRSAGPRRVRRVARRGEVLVPDAVLRGRPAGVAGLHVPVAEAGIDAQRDRPAIAGRRQSLRIIPGEPTLGSTPCSSTTSSALSRKTSAVKHHDRRLVPDREAGARARAAPRCPTRRRSTCRARAPPRAPCAPSTPSSRTRLQRSAGSDRL